MQVISLELNELNFHFIKDYLGTGKLPHFSKLFSEYQLFETVAEKAYPQLEPWIQWPTVYTGKSYAEHGLFRLGDCVLKAHPQIWDELEAMGYSVAAISPMNANNRCLSPDFFLPDPWTDSKIVADPRLEKLFTLIRDVVSDNASSDLSTFTLARKIAPLAAPYLQVHSLSRYLTILPTALRHKWAKAAFLDSLLADLFIVSTRRHGTQFASLFLNAGAHIQHHYMYDSKVYSGDRSNPDWYSNGAKDVDPLLFIYGIYDRIVGQFMNMQGVRLMITTGLSQVPNEREHYQYRIIDFAKFFSFIDLDHAYIEPRMSRDFLVGFADAQSAHAAAERLGRIRCAGKPLFIVDERGDTLFCQVGYFGPPEGLKTVSIDGIEGDRSADFVLVSIENGIHQTIGYHVDTAIPRRTEVEQIPLTEVHDRMIAAVVDSAGQPASMPLKKTA